MRLSRECAAYTILPDQVMSITLKNEHDIAQMRVACRLASEVLDFITPHIMAGVTTGELDRLCHEYMVKEQGTVPAPLNYQPPGYPPYPKATCISVNDVICHGIPGDKALKNGDALNIDVTVIKDGYLRRYEPHVLSSAKRRFSRNAWCRPPSTACGSASIRCVPARISATSAMRSRSTPSRRAIASCASIAATASARCSTRSRRCCTTARPGTGIELEPGMIFTVEPMINAGRRDIRDNAGRWTVKTQRSQSVGAVGAHGARHADGLRRADGVGGDAGAVAIDRGDGLKSRAFGVRAAIEARKWYRLTGRPTDRIPSGSNRSGRVKLKCCPPRESPGWARRPGAAVHARLRSSGKATAPLGFGEPPGLARTASTAFQARPHGSPRHDSRADRASPSHQSRRSARRRAS